MLLDITNTHNSVLMDEAGSEIEKAAGSRADPMRSIPMCSGA